MRVFETVGNENLAVVYIGKTESGRMIEFVESIQPPFTREEKWVLIVSTLYGCPVKCEMCDAGGFYSGKLTVREIFSQIDYMISRRYPLDKIPVKRLKIQFARMGEPSFNNNVLDVLKRLPERYVVPCLIPSVSTIAPLGRDSFFEELIDIKNGHYRDNFQLQFSIHTTDEAVRDKIIPVKKWGLKEISNFGRKFFKEGDKKITLNFILTDRYPINTEFIKSIFDPSVFLVKMTPLNPTCSVASLGLKSAITAKDIELGREPPAAARLRDLGYDVIVSIGELEENHIGSNCGQYIKRFQEYSAGGGRLKDGYTFLKRKKEFLHDDTQTIST